mgnify:CR=1 FL=1
MKEGQIIQDYSATEFENLTEKSEKDGTAGLCSGKSPYARDVDIRKNHNGTS